MCVGMKKLAARSNTPASGLLLSTSLMRMAGWLSKCSMIFWAFVPEPDAKMAIEIIDQAVKSGGFGVFQRYCFGNNFSGSVSVHRPHQKIVCFGSAKPARFFWQVVRDFKSRTRSQRICNPASQPQKPPDSFPVRFFWIFLRSSNNPSPTIKCFSHVRHYPKAADRHTAAVFHPHHGVFLLGICRCFQWHFHPFLQNPFQPQPISIPIG